MPFLFNALIYNISWYFSTCSFDLFSLNLFSLNHVLLFCLPQWQCLKSHITSSTALKKRQL